jgi:arylsulfatase A-like enzyme
MNRTWAIQRIVFLIVVQGLWSLPADADTRPNVLLIAVDDLNDWVGYLGGHPQSVTPKLDRLAKQSTVFTNAHCQGTMCNPSRISFLWGMRPSTTGFYNNRYGVENEKQFLKQHTSLPAYFRKHGYHILTSGKIFHTSEPGNYSHVKGPRPGFTAQGKDKFIHSDPKRWHKIWDFGPQEYAEEAFVDHVVASWAVEQLERKMKSPFFMSVGFYRPHVPFFPPKRVYDKFDNIQLPRVKADDWDDIPEAARELTLGNPKIPTHDWMQQDNRWEEAVHTYLASINWMDEQLGRVLDALDKGPHADNTIVVLLSDHGYHLG